MIMIFEIIIYIVFVTWINDRPDLMTQTVFKPELTTQNRTEIHIRIILNRTKINFKTHLG